MHKITYDYHELDCDIPLDHEFECDNIKDYDEGDSEAIEEAEQLAKNGDYNGEGADVEFEIYRVVNDIRDDDYFHSGSITIEPSVPECCEWDTLDFEDQWEFLSDNDLLDNSKFLGGDFDTWFEALDASSALKAIEGFIGFYTDFDGLQDFMDCRREFDDYKEYLTALRALWEYSNLDLPEPDEFDNDGEHDWHPQDIGCDENKGCLSSGGSVICHTECKKCGLKKSIDYWDHDLDCPHEGKIEYSK